MLQLLVVLLRHCEPLPDKDETVYDQCSDVGYKLCSFEWTKALKSKKWVTEENTYQEKGHTGKTNCSIANVPVLLSIWTYDIVN